MIFTYQHNGKTYTVNLESRPDGTFDAVIDERRYRVEAQPTNDGGWLLCMDGRLTLVYSAASGDERYVYLDGQDYALTVPDARSQHRRSASGGGDLTAQMPGQVMEVLVAEGARVESGQTLVILEAMKMEIRVTAPYDGVVKRVLVAAGHVVERGQRLAEIGVD